MSPLAASSIFSSTQIVTKGAKGQLFKNRPNDKPPQSANFYLRSRDMRPGDDGYINVPEGETMMTLEGHTHCVHCVIQLTDDRLVNLGVMINQ